MKVHCFFEQSGTFKNEFKKLGVKAFDYDILNDFGQTDYVMDLFNEINNAYENKPSIFDEIAQDDLIFAFFPCIRFENQIMLSFRGQARQLQEFTDKEKIMFDMKLIDELRDLYILVNKMFLVCIDRNLRLIMENPYSEEHFLRRYWCILPKIIDKDRRVNGDYYKKPTQYWFVNCEPKQNMLFEPIIHVPPRSNWHCDSNKKMKPSEVGAKNMKVARSMIHPQYANRFIRQYILDDPEGVIK